MSFYKQKTAEKSVLSELKSISYFLLKTFIIFRINWRMFALFLEVKRLERGLGEDVVVLVLTALQGCPESVRTHPKDLLSRFLNHFNH